MNARYVKPFAAIAGSGAVAAEASFAMGAAGSGALAGDMSTGVTITAATPPTAVPEAVPAIKGPAPLPPEEQGLPG